MHAHLNTGFSVDLRIQSKHAIRLNLYDNDNHAISLVIRELDIIYLGVLLVSSPAWEGHRGEFLARG